MEQKRLSILVPKDIADAISDISKIHNLTTTDIVNKLKKRRLNFPIPYLKK